MPKPFDLADEHSPSILVAILVMAYNRLADQDHELARDTVAQLPSLRLSRRPLQPLPGGTVEP